MALVQLQLPDSRRKSSPLWLVQQKYYRAEAILKRNRTRFLQYNSDIYGQTLRKAKGAKPTPCFNPASTALHPDGPRHPQRRPLGAVQETGRQDKGTGGDDRGREGQAVGGVRAGQEREGDEPRAGEEQVHAADRAEADVRGPDKFADEAAEPDKPDGVHRGEHRHLAGHVPDDKGDDGHPEGGHEEGGPVGAGQGARGDGGDKRGDQVHQRADGDGLRAGPGRPRAARRVRGVRAERPLSARRQGHLPRPQMNVIVQQQCEESSTDRASSLSRLQHRFEEDVLSQPASRDIYPISTVIVAGQAQQQMKTCFIVAVKKGNLKLVRKLADKLGDTPSHEMVSGRSLYSLAAERQDLEMIDQLHQISQVSLDVMDLNGIDSALSQCIKDDYREGVVFLLERGVDANVPNIRGDTAIHFAAEFGTPKMLQLLIKDGAKPDAVSTRGQALRIAAQSGNKQCYNYLKSLKVNWQEEDLVVKKRERVQKKPQKIILRKSLRKTVTLEDSKQAREEEERPAKESEKGEKGRGRMETEEGGRGRWSTAVAGGIGFLLGLSSCVLHDRLREAGF